MKEDQDLQDKAVIRLIKGRLAWYPPGAVHQLQWLDNAAEEDRLRELIVQRQTGIVFAAPGTDVRLVEREISADEKKHIAKALPYMLEDSVAADVDALHFAARVLDKFKLSVAICAAQKMREWQSLLAQFGNIGCWIPEPLLLPWQEGEWCVVLDSDLAIVRTGEAEGFSIEREHLPTVLVSAIEEFELPQRLVVYGHSQAEDLLLLPDPLRGSAQWRRGDLSAAMLLGGVDLAVINLLQGSFASQLPLGRWWRQWRAVAAVFAVAFSIHLIGVYAQYIELKKENTQLRIATEQSYRTVIPKGAVPRPEKQLQDQVNALRGAAQTGGFVSLVTRIGEVMVSKPGSQISTINYSDRRGDLRMTITAPDFEAVEAVRTTLNNAGLRAVMENSNTQGGKVRARIRVGGGG
ncbi:MAG: type II secretion system protein GspL [Halieaceae bacterium]|nr:type II secretion system protein GspL [Halieaceae bacterium]